MPHIDNKHESSRRPVVPHFVFKTVIEYEHFTLLPSPEQDRVEPNNEIPHSTNETRVHEYKWTNHSLRFVGDSDGHARRHNQPQMSPQATVGRTTVRPHMRARFHNTELDLPATTARRWVKVLDGAARERHPITLSAFHTSAEQFKLLPISYFSQLLRFVAEQSGSLAGEQVQGFVPYSRPICFQLPGG